MSKGAKRKKGEAAAEGDAPALPTGPQLVSLRENPAVAARVRKAKAWGGLIAFVLIAWGSSSKGASVPDALLRGLVAGIIGLHVTWLAAVVAARRILKAQTVALVEQTLERRRLEAGRS